MNLLVILGATCSGKSKMSVQIAQKYQKLGQKVAIVNCDSRQIYQNLDIGTAKVNGIWQKLNSKNLKINPKTKENQQLVNNSTQNKQKNYKIEEKTPKFGQNLKQSELEKQNLSIEKNLICKQNLLEKQLKNAFFWEGIPHFLIDFVPVSLDYNLVDFVQNWCELITFWQENNSFDLVILTGGTGLWAKAIAENFELGIIKNQHLENWQNLKTELGKLNLKELQEKYLEKSENSEKSDILKNSQIEKIREMEKLENLELYSKSYQFAKSPFQGKCPIGWTGICKSESGNLSEIIKRENLENLELTKQNDEIINKKENNLDKNSHKNSQIKLIIQNQNCQSETEKIQKNSSEVVNSQTTNSNLENLETVNLGTQKFGQKLNNSDFQNPVRLINWLLRRQSCEKNWQENIHYPKFTQTKIVAIKTVKTELNRKIAKSVMFRVNLGLLGEVERLVTRFERQKILNLGLEYRESLRLLESEIDAKTWENNLITQNQQYAKRQITWLNRENLTGNLLWIENVEELEKLLENWEF